MTAALHNFFQAVKYDAATRTKAKSATSDQKSSFIVNGGSSRDNNRSDTCRGIFLQFSDNDHFIAIADCCADRTEQANRGYRVDRRAR